LNLFRSLVCYAYADKSTNAARYETKFLEGLDKEISV
jgi:hypothetical protein